VGALGFDDYATISGVNFTKAKFVGGLTRASGLLGSSAVMWFEFFTPGFAFDTSYGVILPVPGNYIWTISGLTGAFPHSGFHQIVANSTTTGGGVTTGGAPLFQTFAFIPEPTTLGLLGAGILLILRRRR
jgi:hypothetical protein